MPGDMPSEQGLPSASRSSKKHTQGGIDIDSYDIVFVGHLNRITVIPFEGSPYVEESSPVLIGAIAAACSGRRIAAVTRLPEGEEHLLEPAKAAGVDLFVQPGEVTEGRVVFTTANVDQRHIFRTKPGEPFAFSELPHLEPCLVHLCWLDACGFQPDLMRALKAGGFRLSVDITAFMLQTDETGAAHLEDVAEKEEILSMVDFVKLDVVEAQVLTGTDNPQDQAVMLEDWGSPETIITSSEGVLARNKGKTAFVRFTNRNTRGRMGRGDTVMGSYLAWRLDHSVEDSLRFAAALTSIKLESPGPFKGSLDEVMRRMLIL